MSSDPSSPVPESSYPPLEKPDIKSSIPLHLLADASPAERHIMGELSKLSAFADWSIQAHMSTHQQVRKTNGRLIRAESNITDLNDDRRSIISGWRLLATIGIAIGSLVGLITGLISAFGGVGK